MEDLIPIIAILCTIGLPIATGLVIGLTSVKNDHKERMGLINQGIIPPNRTKIAAVMLLGFLTFRIENLIFYGFYCA